MLIRPARTADDAAIWSIIEPTIRAGETYPQPRDMTRQETLDYWHTPGHRVFVAEETGGILGTYYLRAMQFNFVISRNEAAIHLWQACGFDIVGRLPGAFDHPRFGLVDAFVMHRAL